MIDDLDLRDISQATRCLHGHDRLEFSRWVPSADGTGRMPGRVDFSAGDLASGQRRLASTLTGSSVTKKTLATIAKPIPLIKTRGLGAVKTPKMPAEEYIRPTLRRVSDRGG
jgi:hypothetical protein